MAGEQSDQRLGRRDQGRVEGVGIGPADDVGPRLRLELPRDPDELEAILRRQKWSARWRPRGGSPRKGRPRADYGGRPSRSSLISRPCMMSLSEARSRILRPRPAL